VEIWPNALLTTHILSSGVIVYALLWTLRADWHTFTKTMLYIEISSAKIASYIQIGFCHAQHQWPRMQPKIYLAMRYGDRLAKVAGNQRVKKEEFPIFPCRASSSQTSDCRGGTRAWTAAVISLLR
jgi:hypothetical protein